MSTPSRAVLQIVGGGALVFGAGIVIGTRRDEPARSAAGALP